MSHLVILSSCHRVNLFSHLTRLPRRQTSGRRPRPAVESPWTSLGVSAGDGGLRADPRDLIRVMPARESDPPFSRACALAPPFHCKRLVHLAPSPLVGEGWGGG